MYSLLKQFLFTLPPETAHRMALWLLRQTVTIKLLQNWQKRSPCSRSTSAALPGRVLRNPIGLAAGADKNAVALAAWEAIGFGFVEVGTVTPLPQVGNPPPRLWRIEHQHALVNSLGFPNEGADAVASRLCAWRQKHPLGQGMLIGVNCGKQKDTSLEFAVKDYLAVVKKCYPYADFLVLNVSSPNTPGLRSLQNAENIYPLVREIAQFCSNSSSTQPGPALWVKISPDLDKSSLIETADAISQAGAQAIVATNTTTDSSLLPGTFDSCLCSGGISGAPLFPRALERVKTLRSYFCGRIALVGCGGILGVEQAKAYLEAGAELLELYTGLVYKGPRLVQELANTVSQE